MGVPVGQGNGPVGHSSEEPRKASAPRERQKARRAAPASKRARQPPSNVGAMTRSSGAATPALLFNGLKPGPRVRARRGDEARITLDNHLPEETSAWKRGCPRMGSSNGSSRSMCTLSQEGRESSRSISSSAASASPAWARIRARCSAHIGPS
jgi:FtsP/CotA-like multicopper oxidase with cupredoxin domain